MHVRSCRPVPALTSGRPREWSLSDWPSGVLRVVRVLYVRRRRRPVPVAAGVLPACLPAGLRTCGHPAVANPPPACASIAVPMPKVHCPRLLPLPAALSSSPTPIALLPPSLPNSSASLAPLASVLGPSPQTFLPFLPVAPRSGPRPYRPQP